LYVVALIAGVYVAAAGPLKSEDWPSGRAWQPGAPLFITLIVAGVYIALFTFYKQAESRAARGDARRADATLLCQQMAWHLATQCPGIALSKLAVSFWVCKRKGRFDRTIRFYLPGSRGSSGVPWEKGKGVAGWLWEHGQQRAMSEKLQTRNAMSKRAFDQEPPARRLGLSYAEWQLVINYTAVYAMKEFRPDSANLLGILVIDYAEALTQDASGDDQLVCVKKIVQDDGVFSQYRGAIAKTLGE
jgi:hypothetical protein